MSKNERLSSQLAFLKEAAKLKGIERKTKLLDGSRFENAAEHSWHVLLSALLLQEHASEPVDMLKVLKMLAIHDLGEIDSGDTFHYEKDRVNTHASEAEGAVRLFSFLPEDQAADLMALWQEFEARETAEAKFAAALDRIWPIIQNVQNGGETWRRLGVTQEMAFAKNKHVKEGSPQLWTFLQELFEMAEAEEMFTKKE